MRILIAPDKFAGTLSAPQAAQAIADGWARTSPGDELTLAPMADGGPGFVDTLHAVFGSQLLAVTVRGPLGEPTPVSVLVHGDTAYIEAAQACGLHLVSSLDPLRASSFGVGEAVAAALQTGVSTVVVGLGGSATNDGGAGLLCALGATADRPLDQGPLALSGLTTLDVSAVRERLGEASLQIASDVSVPLLGMFGATRTFGPQKGLDEAQVLHVDSILDAYVDALCGPTPAERRIADAPGAGAAGGLGFALLAIGGVYRSGIQLVAEVTGLAAQAREHDLIISGEGAFDYSSRAGKVVHGVAEIAQAAARPCIVLAGRVDVGSREMRALGVESAYSVVDLVGEQAAMAEPARRLAELSQRVAKTWSR